MNKKLLILLLSLTLLQTPAAEAGFFDAFRQQLAAIGLAFSNLFRSAPPRSVLAPVVSSSTDSDLGDGTSTNSTLGEDPNNYQASAQVETEPAKAECVPRSVAHRCSYLEGDQIVGNTCVNPVAVRAGLSGGNSGVKSTN